jgi:hypothetical protein
MKLVLATHNQHKVKEVGAILGQSVTDLELLGYDGAEPIEDGQSFLENALIKARAAHLHTGLPAIADDSGIAVEILGGSPGIFSAGWSGTRDNETNRKIIDRWTELIDAELTSDEKASEEKQVEMFPVFDTLDRLYRDGFKVIRNFRNGRFILMETGGKVVMTGSSFRDLCVNIVLAGLQ